MDQSEAALRELERIQEIISRHEAHVFSLRGWMLTVMGALLAAYYADRIHVQLRVIQIALPVVAVLFLLLEIPHCNLVEALVERARAIEQQLQRAILPGYAPLEYDGPHVADTCHAGATRLWPRLEMTFLLNSLFYVIVIVISLGIAFELPPR